MRFLRAKRESPVRKLREEAPVFVRSSSMDRFALMLRFYHNPHYMRKRFPHIETVQGNQTQLLF